MLSDETWIVKFVLQVWFFHMTNYQELLCGMGVKHAQIF